MKKTGFTLIELLIVVTIIGIVASIVIVALNTARGKAANVSVKANLSNMRTQAELSYDDQNPNSYINVCDNVTVDAALDSAISAGGGSGICNDGVSGWAAAVQLKTLEGSNNTWCVDNTGVSKAINVVANPWDFSATVCP